MNATEIELGAVFKSEWDDRPCRIIAFDDNEVMYDCWSAPENDWSYGALNGTINYYRISIDLLASRCRYIETDMYSSAEFNIHRPDLPFSIGRYNQIQWTGNPFRSESELEAILGLKNEAESGSNFVNGLNAPKLYLSPFGTKGGSRKALLINAKNGTFFTLSELIFDAWNLQSSHVGSGQIANGIGLYRSGLKNKIPSYYIWGSKSRAAYEK